MQGKKPGEHTIALKKEWLEGGHAIIVSGVVTDAHGREQRATQTIPIGEAKCPVLMFGDDVWRERAGVEAVRLAETLEAPVFATRQIFPNFPTRHPLYCGMYPVARDFEKVTGLKPDLIFMAGVQGVHGGVAEPFVIQIGPNPLLMGRHYPLDIAAQCRHGGPPCSERVDAEADANRYRRCGSRGEFIDQQLDRLER